MCSHHHGPPGLRHCCPPTAQVRRLVQPWVLLMLLRKPCHGYELMRKLVEEEEAPNADPGLLYPLLRHMEQEGLLRSTWDTEGKGAARRLYEVTSEGVEYLHAWAVNIRQTKERLERFLTEYESQFPDESQQR